MSDDSLSNLEYCEAALKLREAVMKQEGYDPFVPMGHNVQPDANDYQTAQNVADVLKECIEYAQGDSQLFTQELQRRTMEDTLPRKSRR